MSDEREKLDDLFAALRRRGGDLASLLTGERGRMEYTVRFDADASKLAEALSDLSVQGYRVVSILKDGDEFVAFVERGTTETAKPPRD